MPALEIASAVELAGLTYGAIELVRQVGNAHSAAEKLYTKLQRLRRVVENVKMVEEWRQEQTDSRSDERVLSLERGLGTLIEECQLFVQQLNARLTPLVERPRKNRWKEATKFVKDNRKISAAVDAIEAYLQDFIVYLSLLGQANVLARQQNEAENTPSASADQSLFQHMMGIIQNVPEFFASQRPFASSSVLSDEETDDAADETTSRPGPERVLSKFMPIAEAVRKNQEMVVKQLIEEGADLSITDEDGWTLIHHAVHRRAVETVQVLLDKMSTDEHDLADVKTDTGRTALMLAAQTAYEEKSLAVARMLIKHGCAINEQDTTGQNALCFAIDGRLHDVRWEFVKLLHENGADVEPARKQGQSRLLQYDFLQDAANASAPAGRQRNSSTVSRFNLFGTRTCDNVSVTDDAPASSSTNASRLSRTGTA